MIPNEHDVDVMILDSDEALRTVGSMPNGDVVFAPFGTWRVREINCVAALPPITKTKYDHPRPEQYILAVTNKRPDTVAFEYDITGRSAAGVIRTITGTFERNDDPPFAPCSYTILRVGILTDVSVRITELTRRPCSSFECADTRKEDYSGGVLGERISRPTNVTVR